MRIPQIQLIYFFYGLSFFTMGIVVFLELDRCSDTRLRNALRFLAGFGLFHGIHEWLEMFDMMGGFPTQREISTEWLYIRIAILAFSFLCLNTFGVTLLVQRQELRRLSLLVPLSFTAIWSYGLLYWAGRYSITTGFADVMDVWTRYVLAIPAAMLACAGLIFQQREFRRAGMAQFGRDSLWAAIGFAWYGLVGQSFTRPSPLFPSNVINTNLFYQVFGFQVQLLRAAAAMVAAVFVIRFLRSFEVETQRMIDNLQADRLKEAERRETLRGELLRRVVAAQESERQRIARELHDDTGQSLTAIGLGLRGATTTLRQDPEKASSNLRRLEKMVADSLNELQRIIGDLRPSHLDDLGLAAAIRWYCHDLEERVPFDIHLDIQGEASEIPAEVKTAVFRITQEALTNVIRHSSAENVEIRLNFQDNTVQLVVEDDGAGFDISEMTSAKRPAWGVLGMEERASLLGGRLEIYSSPGKGT
ncbi:MAG: sensor histidine kinase, partial [Omnitrophica WOR_2 bacterium]